MIKLFDYLDVKEWENYTLVDKKLSDLKLMYKASEIFANWLDKKLLRDDMTVAIVCGSGNNGGDGYCLASILKDRNVKVSCYSYDFGEKSDLCLHYSQNYLDEIIKIHSKFDFSIFDQYTFVIDALLGTGISRPLEGELEKIIHKLNDCQSTLLSLDIPSGVFPDAHTHSSSIYAQETLSFQIPKRAFFSRENYKRIGKWEFRDIGLSDTFVKKKECDTFLIQRNDLKPYIKKRSKFTHKYKHGNHLIVGGNIGMAGAITLSTHSSYRMGTGLVSILGDESNRMIHQIAVPESIFFSKIEHIDWNKITGITFGPGAGDCEKLLDSILDLELNIPLLIDADGLNIISDRKWQDRIPKNTIITPHLGEFNRLFGSCSNDFEYWELQKNKSKELGIYIVLKGAHTAISTPDGNLYYNDNGNPGMATAGTGDVLSGMIGALLSQQYSPLDATLLGVYMHGLSGDLALKSIGMEAIIATDLVHHIPKVWQIMKS